MDQPTILLPFSRSCRRPARDIGRLLYNGVVEIRERQTGDVAIVELAGRVTVNDRPGLLKEAVAGAVGRGARHVLLDLSGVYYIDSTRLGELIAAHITVTRQGGRLKLVATPERIVELLLLAGLDGVFERFATVDEAQQSLAG
jgi:anti-sigma B factor antagonist